MPCIAFGQVFQHGELNVGQAWYAFHRSVRPAMFKSTPLILSLFNSCYVFLKQSWVVQTGTWDMVTRKDVFDWLCLWSKFESQEVPMVSWSIQMSFSDWLAVPLVAPWIPETPSTGRCGDAICGTGALQTKERGGVFVQFDNDPSVTDWAAVIFLVWEVLIF